MEQPKAFYIRRSQLVNLDPCQRYFSTNLPPVSLFIIFITDKSTRNLIFKKHFIFWSLVKWPFSRDFCKRRNWKIPSFIGRKSSIFEFRTFMTMWFRSKIGCYRNLTHVWEIFDWKRHWVALTAWGDVISLGWNIFFRFQMQLNSEYQQFFVFSRAFLW